MGIDPLSFAAPARIKLLLLPVGSISQSRFEIFVKRLEACNVVRLGDVSPSSKPNRTLFSPLAFPEGLVVYDIVTAVAPSTYASLVPFELFRQPLLVAGVLDGDDVNKGQVSGVPLQNGNEAAIAAKEEEVAGVSDKLAIHKRLEEMKDAVPDALLYQLLVFESTTPTLGIQDDVFMVPSPQNSRTTTIKTLMCDLTSRLLAELAAYAKSIQDSTVITTPGLPNLPAASDGTPSAFLTHITKTSRPSLIEDPPRVSSPSGDEAKWRNRMSLPVSLPSNKISRSATPNSRPGSPPSITPGMSAVAHNSYSARDVASTAQSSNQERSRPASQDRSMNNFESSNIAERERIKQKGRAGVIIGSMFLLSGRWSDAIKEFISSINAARANSDYVWQAKALEYLLVCLTMCAWAGMDFHLPDVLRPASERPGSNSSKVKNTSSAPDHVISQNVDPEKRLSTVQALASVLPDILHSILNLYSRSWTFTDDKIPPLCYSHSVLRFTKLLVTMQNHDDQLGGEVLDHIVNGQVLQREQRSPVPRRPFVAMELSNLVFRAYPMSLSLDIMSVDDQIAILASIASVLSDLGFRRKKALVLKDLMSFLLPALVQARKHGAAEMGMHPAASLASLGATLESVDDEWSAARQEDSEKTMCNFLAYICNSFGISVGLSDQQDNSQIPNADSSVQDNSKALSTSSTAYVAIERAIKRAITTQKGSMDLKINVLRACINICEALPSLAGALQYSAELLRTAGSGIAPGPDSSNGQPSLPIEEQVRLSNNISRTLSASQHIKLARTEAEYWDEFLVRGVGPLDLRSTSNLVPHARSELAIADVIETKKERNPFIYNPFLKASPRKDVEPLLVAEEEAVFGVTLQNLYDFDLYIEKIQLEADTPDLVTTSQSLMVGPYRTQVVLLPAMPKASGTFKIIGCRAKVRGCRERTFLTFKEPWEYKIDIKDRRFYLDFPSIDVENGSSEPNRRVSKLLGDTPKAFVLSSRVINPQPYLRLSSISLPQSALMLLEGETRRFSLVLENTSQSVAADLVLISFSDSSTSQIKSTLGKKDLSGVELYELEISAARRPPFVQVQQNDRAKSQHGTLSIAPRGILSLNIEAYGKPGLSSATVQVDYGNLGIPRDEIKEEFYTRKLNIPIAITVNATIDLVRSDIISLPQGFSWGSCHLDAANHTGIGQLPLNPENEALISGATSSEVILVLDFRNSWPKLLTVQISLTNSASKTSRSGTETNTATTTYAVAPGTTSRIPLPVPKIYLSPSQVLAPVPSLGPATARQFVVSNTKPSATEEIAHRESFWYREELLKRISAEWIEADTGKRGRVEMRALRLTGRMVAALRLDDISIEMRVESANRSLGHPGSTTNETSEDQSSDAIDDQSFLKADHQSYRVPVNKFLNLKTKLINRSDAPIKAILRLQPTLAGQTHSIALDLRKKLLVNGLLQRVLPAIAPGEHVELETQFVVLSRGLYEWTACVEEVQSSSSTGVQDESGPAGNRARAKTGATDLRGELGRRFWYNDSVCSILAR